MTASSAAIAGVPAVSSFISLLNKLLDEAAKSKPTPTIEPALNESDFDGLSQRVGDFFDQEPAELAESGDGERTEVTKARDFAVVETAAREIFDKLISTTPIESAKFVKMWNLLDILGLLSDEGRCEPALLFWLVEELLDSQTIAGCRKIFDYLESRRERITANHFKQKNLVILRSCNELLRRLSRAEDTAFCGRVFIFLFQSFPLGDRSSVNLRGEYHVENVTNYEKTDLQDLMDVDTDNTSSKANAKTEGPGKKGANSTEDEKRSTLTPAQLYPLFWSLQETFSQPMLLFEPANFSSFKHSLSATMGTFSKITPEEKSRVTVTTEEQKTTLKRKRGDADGEDLLAAFNPKYLTSKDLFELEISDLSFRRHVLVQALIVINFLLSLSTTAKAQLEPLTSSNKAINKAVIYSFVLSEDDTQWTIQIKDEIGEYLRLGDDGPYFFRMVQTVLARDRNWTVWKMTSCPPIKEEPVTPELFNEARTAAQRMATSKRLRPTPIGSVPLDFLVERSNQDALKDLAVGERYMVPDLDDFRTKIANDDFEIEMPTNEETKAAAIAGKASKSWRALRLAARDKLVAFDKIEDPKKIGVVFEDPPDLDEDAGDQEPVADAKDMPSDLSPIILSGPRLAGKSTLAQKLMRNHPGVFSSVARHTTRSIQEGETAEKDFVFVGSAEFNKLRDGDKLVEFGQRDGVDYGTSAKAIDSISEAGKVPVIELDLEAARFAKDMDFAARYVLIRPRDVQSLSERLTKSGNDEDLAKKSMTDMEAAIKDKVFAYIITNDEVEDSAQALWKYISTQQEDVNAR